MLNFAEQTGSGAVTVVWSFLSGFDDIINLNCCSLYTSCSLIVQLVKRVPGECPIRLSEGIRKRKRRGIFFFFTHPPKPIIDTAPRSSWDGWSAYLRASGRHTNGVANEVGSCKSKTNEIGHYHLSRYCCPRLEILILI